MLADVLSATVPTIVPAAVAVIAVDGEVVAAEAAGELVRYTDPDGTLAPVRPPARRDSVFDLASISKLFTTSVILSLVAEGRLDLDAPVATWLPAFYADRPHITLRHLLTHTAGLQPTHRVDHVSPAARHGHHPRHPDHLARRRSLPVHRRRHGDGGTDRGDRGSGATGRNWSAPA
ncbi:serine hydrolase domain-containing protein [Nonomuraea dietziae]|uniref:serine hydrolase domain-containing protein n=1 Tax=Nonomuraea dietziae TaxID=65515 RepID=UPI0031DFC800